MGEKLNKFIYCLTIWSSIHLISKWLEVFILFLIFPSLPPEAPMTATATLLGDDVASPLARVVAGCWNLENIFGPLQNISINKYWWNIKVVTLKFSKICTNKSGQYFVENLSLPIFGSVLVYDFWTPPPSYQFCTWPLFFSKLIII